MALSLSCKERFDLIGFIEETPQIWDQSLPTFHKLDVTQECWAQIYRQMRNNGLSETSTVPDLKKAWKSLRDNFKRNDKELPTGSGSLDAKKNLYFDALSFLRKCKDSSVRYSNVGRSPTAPVPEIEPELQARYIEETENAMEIFEPESDTEEYSKIGMRRIKKEVCVATLPSPSTSSTLPARAILGARNEEGHSAKKRKNTDVVQEGMSAIRSVAQSLREKLDSAAPKREPDKFDNFGSFIAGTVRDLPVKRGQQAIVRINSLLGQILDEEE